MFSSYLFFDMRYLPHFKRQLQSHFCDLHKRDLNLVTSLTEEKKNTTLTHLEYKNTTVKVFLKLWVSLKCNFFFFFFLKSHSMISKYTTLWQLLIFSLKGYNCLHTVKILCFYCQLQFIWSLLPSSLGKFHAQMASETCKGMTALRSMWATQCLSIVK